MLKLNQLITFSFALLENNQTCVKEEHKTKQILAKTQIYNERPQPRLILSATKLIVKNKTIHTPVEIKPK